MTDTSPVLPDLSRRSLLKVGVLGSAFLATAGIAASLSGCSSERPATGMQTLRESDLPFLRALIPVVLTGAVPAGQMPAAVDKTLSSLDYSLGHLSPELLKMTQQLFDAMAMVATRGPMTRVWGSWENASPADVHGFLERWRDSSLGLLKMGYASLLQLVLMAWYGNPESWEHCGYPGAPSI